jgi:hypothetical protein
MGACAAERDQIAHALRCNRNLALDRFLPDLIFLSADFDRFESAPDRADDAPFLAVR